MRGPDYLRAVAQNLWALRWRLVLTLLGVAVGTVSVVLMLAVGAGLQRSLDRMFASDAFARRVDVSAQGLGEHAERRRPARPLDELALSRIRALEGVSQVMGTVSVPVGAVRLGRLTASPLVTGVRLEDLRRWGFDLQAGRLPSSPHEILLGSSVPGVFADDAPGSPVTLKPAELLGRSVQVLTADPTADAAGSSGSGAASASRSTRFRVVGVLKHADVLTDTSAIISLTDARALGESASPRAFDSVVVQAASTGQVAAVVERVKSLGFSASAWADNAKALDSVMRVVQLALGAIGAVALFVSALGIANTMTTSILERTRDIGVMMAVGASRGVVLRLYLIESTAIGLVGGALGLAAAGLIAWIANTLIATSGAAGLGGASAAQLFYIPLQLGLFAVGFASVVGLIAGTVPAGRASGLSPVAAIRRE